MLSQIMGIPRGTDNYDVGIYSQPFSWSCGHVVYQPSKLILPLLSRTSLTLHLGCRVPPFDRADSVSVSSH